jgi:phosphoglycolate phosphatase
MTQDSIRIAADNGFATGFDIVGFDLDGTLLDSSIELSASLNHTLVGAGYPAIAAAEVRSLVGMGARHMLERALARHGEPDPAEVKALIGVLVAHYEAHLGSDCPAFPGLISALDALTARGVRLAVVTNKFEHLAVKLLTNVGLIDRFASVIGGDTMDRILGSKGNGKPSPAPIHEMIRRCSADGGGAKAVFVGDAWPDFAAAAAAGIPCVGVRFGFDPPHQGDAAPNIWIDHYDGLLPALSALG